MTVLIEGIAALRGTLRPLREAGPVGLVPTMGALHAGHARLLEQARRECRTVVATIFVNPLQFDRDDDLKRYPRTLEGDLELCARGGVDFVFAPPRRRCIHRRRGVPSTLAFSGSISAGNTGRAISAAWPRSC
jgi:pantoate--beta-alanine ligase